MKIKIKLDGVTPLILNKFTDEAALSASSGSRAFNIAGDKGSPKDQATKKLYISTDGKTEILPSPNVFSCIIAAGTFHKAGKSKITTQKSSLIPSCVSIDEIEIPIISKDGWCVDTRAVRIPSTGGRILAHRPIYNDWSLAFTLELDEEFMSEILIRRIIDDSGKRIGLGDFRPSCKGPYGKFVVTKWDKNPGNPL